MVDLSGQTIIVTGASSGLGLRMAKLFAEKGAFVSLVARRKNRLEEIKREIESGGSRAAVINADLGKDTDFESIIDETEKQLAPVTMLVNNAGLNIQEHAHKFTPDQYDTVFNVNLRSAFFLSSALANRWIEREHSGRILNIASLSAYHTIPMITPYAMTKAAMVHMTACMAREWARKDIAVNALAPGYIKTEINEDYWDSPDAKKLIAKFPRRRIGEVTDIDGAALLMLDPEQRFITGQTLILDDGQGLG